VGLVLANRVEGGAPPRPQGLVIGRVGEPGLPAVEVVGELLVERRDADQHRRPWTSPTATGPPAQHYLPQFFPLWDRTARWSGLGQILVSLIG
jgi:hypothetical protein